MSLVTASTVTSPRRSLLRGERLTGHAELVLARSALGIGLHVEVRVVHAGLDHDLALDGPGALLAPRANLVLAGCEALERELLAALRHDVVRRIDDDDVRSHLRVDVAAEAHDAGLLELELARVA